MVMNDKSSDQEINQFNQLADRWWDPNGPMKPLHRLNPLRTSYINTRHPLAGKKVLDVGCGGGLLSEAMAQAGASVTGIDLSFDLIAAASGHAKEQGLTIDYHQRRVSEQASQDTRFDVVTCLELLEHVNDPKTIIEQCAQCLKPGGSLFVSTLNRHPRAFLLGIIAAEYVLNLVPKGTHHYKQFIKPSELNHYAEDAGLEREDIKGFQYHVSTQDFSIDGDLRVNYIAHFVRPKEHA